MAKVSYANLKLKINKDVQSFDFNNQTIEISTYLPIEDKYDLIMITLQQAEEDGIYNPILLDMYFHLNLTFLYTNLSFTEKQKEDLPKLYNTLKSNGFFEAFLTAFDENEYNELYGYIEELIDLNLTYKNSAAAVFKGVIQDLPKNAEAASQIMQTFDPEQYQQVLNFAVAANGGRPLDFTVEGEVEPK